MQSRARAKECPIDVHEKRSRGCSHCEINEFFTMDTLTIADRVSKKCLPMLYDNNANDIPRKDEHDDKLDSLSRDGEDECMANTRVAGRLFRQNPNFSTDLFYGDDK